MKKSGFAAVALAAAVAAGCASEQQMLDQQQEQAINTALNRARFAMNCPSATASVLSREMVQPAINAPMVGGVERAEYTIGIAGCDKRETMVVICPMGGEGCFAANEQ